MAKDPATTRIPRLDGPSRIPPPGSFGTTTSHIKPPTNTATLRATKIFQAPASSTTTTGTIPTKPRPTSSYTQKASLEKLSSSIKRSASGERLNNAVSQIKKYFWQSKAPSSVKRNDMTTSVPITPMPKPKQTVLKNNEPMISSTPMPLMRSETFVCNEDEEEQQQESEQKAEKVVEKDKLLSRCRLSAISFGRTMDLGSPSETRSINSETPPSGLRLMHNNNNNNNLTQTLNTSPLTSLKASENRENTSHDLPMNATQTLNANLGRTMPVICGNDVTQTISGTPHGLQETQVYSKIANLTKTIDSGKDQVEDDLDSTLDATLTALAPDKSNMKLPLNSTLNTERLLNITGLHSPARHIQLLNLTREFMEASPHKNAGTSLYRRSTPQHSLICFSPKSPGISPHGGGPLGCQKTPEPLHLLSPCDFGLHTRTPDGEMVLDSTLIPSSAINKNGRTRYSFGLDLPDTNLDCSIELVDNSFSSSQQQLHQQQQQLFKKQHSFDMDESLGILTPDQMKGFLDSAHNLELQLAAQQSRQMRLEQTPSPEELPLDPVEITTTSLLAARTTTTTTTTKVVEKIEKSIQAISSSSSSNTNTQSNSFITSVTSVTSLDTGYQGDGEMSRPASRGACDHSPSNGPQLGRVSRQPSFPPPIPMRRQDPMTDSDFFTESDADDVLHGRGGDRRAQVIDGQLYGPTMQPSASVPQLEDSCMESSGIFTDVENRCDEEMRRPMEMEFDMSPESDSNHTMRKAAIPATSAVGGQGQQQRPPSSCLSSSSAATTLSNRTSYCSVDGGSTKSFCDEAFSNVGVVGDQPQRSSMLSVQLRASPRPHASSLSSLCTAVENSVSTTTSSSASSSSSLAASPKSCKAQKPNKNSNHNLNSHPTTPRSVKSSGVTRKSHTPNKWDAVMNKIASNKSLIKTNYNDVKSKVSSTRAMTSSPTATTTTTTTNGSTTTPASRRSPSVTPKASPKTTLVVKRSPSKTATPSPPPLALARQPQDKGSVGASGGAGGAIGRTSLVKSPTTPTSPPAKRLQQQAALIKRGRSYSKESQKSSQSELSLLCNVPSQTATGATQSSSVSGSGYPKQLAKTPLRAAKKRDVRNLSISPTDLGPPPKTQQTGKGQSTRSKSSSLAATPTALQKRLNSNTLTTATTTTTIISPNSKGNTNKSIQSSKQQQTSTKLKSTSIKNSTTILPQAEGISEESLRSGVDQTELQELPPAKQQNDSSTPRDSKRASISNELQCICGSEVGCNCLQTEAKVKRCETPPRETAIEGENIQLNNDNDDGDKNKENLQEDAKFNTSTNELDAFACRETKDQCARAKGTLDETITLLQQTQRSCKDLRQELHNKDLEWTQREQERDHLQRNQLKQSEDKLLEMQMIAQERFQELKTQMAIKEAETKQAQESYHTEMNHKLNLKQEQLTAAEEKILMLQQRIQNLETQDQELRDEISRKEKSHASQLAASAQREEELQQRVNTLTKELSSLSASKESNERELRDRLALSEDEISILRHTSQRRSPSTSLPDTSAELRRLTSEADSLRCVLELKQAEISTLTKANEDLRRENDERMRLSSRVALLEAQNEMLRTELDTKTEREKSLQLKMDEMRKAYDHENIKRSRLTCDKEVLEYHLKQRSERLQQVEAKLQEVSQDIGLNLSSHSRCSLGRSCGNVEDGDAISSPPSSPVIKGVIERNESVSWILDMDDDVPKVPAPKIVRRAGSLRNTSERSPTQRRQLSMSATTNGSAHHHTHNGTAGGGGSGAGPIPLSQSMSAAALLRSNHSISSDTDNGIGQPLSRTRSHSVCIRASSSSSSSSDAAVANENGRRQRIEDEELLMPEWNADILCSSSPQQQSDMRPRSSTMKLTPRDAKLSKKFQEIQESAGEAMVSGANSEDESCSASSEEMMRSSSASSTASGNGGGCGLGGGDAGRPKQPLSRMSIEEALPCTPMEVSWSEDAADAVDVDSTGAPAAALRA
ncbi:serine-rich adhesin for platelets isoform X2 [Drosophila tropicalis]|uniref:serine-rich adhesin for platelets isoform X2 n=1 Tax=Drosophila tropicalis TaxID=46794 RepID=UPI0035AC0715